MLLDHRLWFRLEVVVRRAAPERLWADMLLDGFACRRPARDLRVDFQARRQADAVDLADDGVAAGSAHQDADSRSAMPRGPKIGELYDALVRPEAASHNTYSPLSCQGLGLAMSVVLTTCKRFMASVRVLSAQAVNVTPKRKATTIAKVSLAMGCIRLLGVGNAKDATKGGDAIRTPVLMTLRGKHSRLKDYTSATAAMQQRAIDRTGEPGGLGGGDDRQT